MLDISPYRKQIEALCRQYHVSRLFLFGSARRDDFDPLTSDVDFIVEFSDAAKEDKARIYFGLLHALVKLLGREVDLVEPSAIKNPYIKRRMDAEQELLYAA